jgi:HEAT repeat protein
MSSSWKTDPADGPRARTLETLFELAGPLGPMGSIEAREARRREVASGAPDWLLDGLVSILTDRPDLPAPVSWDDVEFEIVDLLGAFPAQPDLLARLVPLLDRPSARRTVIEALGPIGDPRAVKDLERMYDRGQLDADELTRLAGSLGEIGGDAAAALLRRIAARNNLPPEARAEVDLALERLGGRDDPAGP